MDHFCRPKSAEWDTGFSRMALSTLTEVVCIIALQCTSWKFGINMTTSGKAGCIACSRAPISRDVCTISEM